MPHLHKETLRQVCKEHTGPGTAQNKEHPLEQNPIPPLHTNRMNVTFPMMPPAWIHPLAIFTGDTL